MSVHDAMLFIVCECVKMILNMLLKVVEIVNESAEKAEAEASKKGEAPAEDADKFKQVTCVCLLRVN